MLHSTMLVHTTERVAVHARMCARLKAERDRFAVALRSGDRSLLFGWREIWTEETVRVRASDLGEVPVSFEDRLPHLAAVLDETAFIEENSQSLMRLSYEVPGRVVVVVEGNVLSPRADP